ncbi:MAG TPA: MFS transporter, partial [Gemmataceae bacterium]|nr:MFS transporter [Gemmataceae bacterium]
MSTAPLFRAPDVRLLFVTRAVRLFAYGFLALILWLYLAELGLSAARIGLLLSMTLVGDVAVSLWITTTADRIGRKWMLIAGAVLMALAGAAFLSTDDFILLLIAATVGVISPSGNEVGPFLAIEQAALAQEVTAQQRTHVFAWYSLTGSLATAFGSLLCGLIVQGLHDYAGISNLQSYRLVLWVYAGVGVILAALFIRLSPAAEATASPPVVGARLP